MRRAGLLFTSFPGLNTPVILLVCSRNDFFTCDNKTGNQIRFYSYHSN